MKRKRNRAVKIERKDVKEVLFVDDVIIAKEKPTQSADKLLELTRKSGQFPCKTNLPKAAVFLYVSKNLLENVTESRAQVTAMGGITWERMPKTSEKKTELYSRT